MILLLAGLLLFFSLHVVPMLPGVRARLTGALGVVAYRGLFSLVAASGLVLIVWGYANARDAGPAILYDPPLWLRHVTLLLMLPVFPLLVASYVPCRLRRIIKHPMLVAIKTWAFAHLLANGDAASVLLFGGFLLFAVTDRISVKRRTASGLVTPPAGGSAGGDIVAVGIGLLLYAAFVWKLHVWIIGVPVM